MKKNKRAIIFIDLATIEDNFKKLRKFIPRDVKILCVVKADAYGHGAIQVARRLESLHVDYLGVATIDEGIELRKAGIQSPVLVMSGIFPWDNAIHTHKYSLTPAVHNFRELEEIIKICADGKRLLKVHIKVDTGMGRLGFTPDRLDKVISRLKEIQNIEIEGLMSHFSSSEKRDEYGMSQYMRFKDAIEKVKGWGIKPKILHMANSGALLNYREAFFSMVRVGISLYGSYPDSGLWGSLGVKQAMKLISKIALIKEFPPGCSLSYGGTFVTQKHTRVAYIPVGYADGYPRALSNKGSVLIKDHRCSIIGRICMDWFLVDVTGYEDIHENEDVILLGQSDTDSITADEIAEVSGTIPYEILCNIAKRAQRIYV